jgi:hypothetical protein
VKKVSSSIFLYISRSYFRDVILMIGSTVYIAQWTLSALYRRPGKGFPYRFSAILLGCVFFFFVSSSCVFILVRCLFFLLYMGRSVTVLLAAGCLFYIIRWIRRCVAIDPYRQLSSILFGRRLSARLMC